jgi:Beta propeller domain
MHTKTAFVVLAALASAAAVGCGSSGGGSGQTGTVRASLHRAKSCGDLLSDLKADAVYKLNKGIDLQIRGIQHCQSKNADSQCVYGGYYSARGGSSFGGAPMDDSATTAPEAAGAGSDGKSTNNGAQSYSETNTQVKGVDEADIVKNDGQNLYVLHGRAFKVLKAWPADQLAEASSIDVEGTPTEMFVADGKVVIYSQVNGTSVFAAANVQPKKQYTEYGSYGAGVPETADVASGASGTSDPYIPLTKVTVMTLNGTTPSVAREVYFEGNYLDARRVGPHVRTVLQGDQYGPQLKYSVDELYSQPTNTATPTTKDQGGSGTPTTDPYPKTGTAMIAALEQLRSVNLAAINGSQLSDWLPYTFVKNGSQVSAETVACEDFYVPTAGSTESGLTEVVSLDLSDPAATPQETAILGRADTVYGNADTLYLAAHAWVEPPFMWSDGGSAGVSSGGTGVSVPPSAGEAPAPTPVPDGKPSQGFNMNVGVRTTPTQPGNVIAYSSTRTHVHKFEFKSDPKFPNYIASGTVAGNVKDQFSLDEKDNVLRIATTDSLQYATPDGQYVNADFSAPANGAPPPARPSTVNHVFTLSENGPWLEQTGDVGVLAPNERIYSVRFVENRGYVVTFRQVDPLFVIDLSTPSTPTLLAALKIPGFSEYMHPLDANHLLTIGRDADANGRQQGLALQIFDVTDGAHPVVMHKFPYAGYGSSEAEYDHKAFTYFADKKLLAFPYYSYGNTDGSMRSSLELFRVDLGSGFEKLGSIDHTSLVQSNPQGYCRGYYGGYYGPSVRRGVFLENTVYSISYGGVIAKNANANDLLGAGNQLALPAPQMNDGYGVCY